MRAPSTPISDERPRKTTSKCSLSLHQKPTIGQPNPRCVAGEGPKKTTEKKRNKEPCDINRRCAFGLSPE